MTPVLTRPQNDTTPSKSAVGRAPIDPIRMVLFPARVFLALGWTRAGIEKLIDPSWWDGAQLRLFLDTHNETRLPFLDAADGLIGSRIAIGLALIVLLVEFGIGLCLITARHLPAALSAACLLNLSFVALGAVTPSAFYLVLQMTLLLSLHVQRPERSARVEVAAVGLCCATAVAMTPFIRTIEPHAVIEDPAIMVATLAMLAAATLTIIAVEGKTAS